MKILINLSLVFIVTLTATSHARMVDPETVHNESYSNNLPIQDGKDVKKIKKTLFEGGKIRGGEETGTFKGIKYRIFSDKSGAIQGLPENTLESFKEYGTNWSLGCSIDEMDDTHFCYLDRKDLRVGIWKDGKTFIWIGNNHYPGSNIALRVDKNKPIIASEERGFTDSQSLEIIEQLKKGTSVLTRYKEWPYQSNEDQSFKTFGFPQAWEILQRVYSSVDEDKL
jgi:hypothetical protein